MSICWWPPSPRFFRFFFRCPRCLPVPSALLLFLPDNFFFPDLVSRLCLFRRGRALWSGLFFSGVLSCVPLVGRLVFFFFFFFFFFVPLVVPGCFSWFCSFASSWAVIAVLPQVADFW
ncbi:uncharacterized protein BYT42DRAFT_170260 [Radiomyces spectabilis]|uniref:uncharacterized protein n=1 Tax=Radiomyces spectabilis TaxID=64574 RepID=UPI00221FA33C|nr:uncharacterized protein BYT42DRAFT_170260 [Radiomyces spectabilis]KAI8364801.1 hypothetical protein BYT42DRAFT_170260 [Radiomyces spectabilis]